MLRELTFKNFNVRISIASLGNRRVVLSSEIANQLLQQLSNIKVCQHGYLLAVTKLNRIGRADDTIIPQYVCFPVDFCCRTFIPMDGEVMTGIVTRVFAQGVLLKSGPMNKVSLSGLKMPGYHFVAGENPVFLCEDLSKIGIGVVVRFVVFGVRWTEAYRDFGVLASIDGDGLGPVSSSGGDESDFF